MSVSNLRKIMILLHAIDKIGKNVDYYALDLSLSELQRTLRKVPTDTFKHVHCHGLLGTYDDGLEWLKTQDNASRSKCIMWLGSSIGNFSRDEAAMFLRRFTSTLSPRDMLIVGIDGCQDSEKVFSAYNDQLGKTHEFVLNGLTHANRLLGKDAFRKKDWSVIGEYDVAAGRHQAFYSSNKHLEVAGVHFCAGERIRIEESYKYSTLQTERLLEASGLIPGASYGDQDGQYRELCLSLPNSLPSRVHPTQLIPLFLVIPRPLQLHCVR